MLNKECNASVSPSFNEVYFKLHDYVYTEGDEIGSRVGTTKEILNFKTALTKPLQRCVAGYNRNINVFFLLAEAMWIFNGRRDVEFLTIFNEGMAEFSDDGQYFHAPYGWRLRHWGPTSIGELDEAARIKVESSKDQLLLCLQMLYNNPEDRRVVASVWNPDLDLAKQSKDLPCNDMLMFKIRHNQLHVTVQNRSNDLNRGLPTNVFQFSFLGELMAQILRVEYGTQTHNSQSLHLYMQHGLTTSIQSEILNIHRASFVNFYSEVDVLPIKLSFDADMPVTHKLFRLDFFIHGIILKLLYRNRGEESDLEDKKELWEADLKQFSFALWYIFQMLKVYVDYKKHKNHEDALNQLVTLYQENDTSRYDISVLAMNFFMCRIHNKDRARFEFITQLLNSSFPRYKGLQLGKL